MPKNKKKTAVNTRWTRKHLHTYTAWGSDVDITGKPKGEWVYARCTNKDGYQCDMPERRFSAEQWMSIPPIRSDQV